MLLQVCCQCIHGAEKDGQSHCGKESVYSLHTRCIQRLALKDYLERCQVNPGDDMLRRHRSGWR